MSETTTEPRNWSTKYAKTRDSTQRAFESLEFDEKDPRASLMALCSKALARYDAEIAWYDEHADRRRFISGAVRFLCVVLGTASVLLVNSRASSLSATPRSDLFGWDLMTLATGAAIAAGAVLLMDTVFQITPRYGRWRVAEYTIRLLRSSFEVDFLRQYGGLARGRIDDGTFNEAKVMALDRFRAVQEEIKSETESWQQGLDKAMTALRQKIERDTEEAKKVAIAAAKADEQHFEQERAKAVSREPVLLDVTIERAVGRPDSLTLVVRDKRKRELERDSSAHAGAILPFALPPGPYTVHLLDPNGKQVDAKSIRLEPETDAKLSI